ncbi:MAG: hypothetical protein NPIRA04_27360 [Nitrospirales bacterium]|nr:MAG: hypothetical protein NPIRA04_27360 [Nitrospirales bacterium]
MKQNRFICKRQYTWTGSIITMAMLMMTLGGLNILTPTAQAQTIPPQSPIPLNRVVYAAKFVCGFKPGFTPPQSRVLLGPAVYDYRDLEPGSYATALNVLFTTGANTTTNINVLASVPETSQNAAVQGVNLGPMSVSNFGTVKVDCEDIAQALNGPLPQVADKAVIEGFLYITRPVDDLVVEAVYSYSSEIGSLGGEPRNEGGIGVGSSIHVQNIEPKSYSFRIPLILNAPTINRTP